MVPLSMKSCNAVKVHLERFYGFVAVNRVAQLATTIIAFMFDMLYDTNETVDLECRYREGTCMNLEHPMQKRCLRVTSLQREPKIELKAHISPAA